MKGGAGDDGQHYQSGDRIMDAVRRVGLPLKLDRRTIGDGNCWHRAIIQQSQRVSVGIAGLTSHGDLRARVCQLALRAELQVIKEMRKHWVQKEPWSAYWERMKGNKVWADHPFIQLTAWLLERDIFVVMDSATPRILLMPSVAAGKDGKNLAQKLLFLLATIATNISRVCFQRMRSHSNHHSLAHEHQKISTRQWKRLYRSREAGRGNTRRQDRSRLNQQQAKEVAQVVRRKLSASCQEDQ